MGVKSIFKILLGTMFGMVVSMLLIELFNVSIASYQLRQICRMSARQACILFTSETYKGDSSVGGSISIQDIKTCDGTTYLPGNFYGMYSIQPPESDAFRVEVWKKIYTSTYFNNFCDKTASFCSYSHGDIGKYYTLPLLKMAASGAIPTVSVSWSSSPAELEAAVKAETARMYRNNYYTTNNIGIPYLDPEVVNAMYQWNLAQLLSNCDPDSVQKDDLGRYCINFMGFKIYADQCVLKNFDYRVYDVSEANPNREVEAERVWNDLNIDVTSGAFHSSGLSNHRKRANFSVETVGGNVIYDNQYITAVGLEYSLAANYEGITPLRKLIAYAYNTRVSGFSKDGEGYHAPTTLSPAAGWTGLVDGNATDTISLGGFMGNRQADGSSSDLVVSTGKLTYTLDR